MDDDERGINGQVSASNDHGRGINHEVSASYDHGRGINDCASAANELDRLYVEFASSLKHIVRGGVGASDAVIEDACQAAWTRLVHHRHRISEQAARGWLTRTAVHEAFRLWRLEVREPPLPADEEHPPLAFLHRAAPDPQQLLEQRQRLDSVGLLPYRQQRVVWLVALGASREEMAWHEHATSRTVRRQLGRARHRLLLIEARGRGARAA